MRAHRTREKGGGGGKNTQGARHVKHKRRQGRRHETSGAREYIEHEALKAREDVRHEVSFTGTIVNMFLLF